MQLEAACLAPLGAPGFARRMALVASPGLAATWPAVEALCESGGTATVLLATYGVAMIVWQALALVRQLLEVRDVLAMILGWLGFVRTATPTTTPTPAPAPAPTPAPTTAPPGPFWACDNIRRSHCYHMRANCSEFKSMTRVWPMVQCAICAE